MMELRVFGSLEVLDDAGRLLTVVMAQPKRAALLVYLAVTRPRGFQRRDNLLALLWPESDDARARGALNQALTFLRRELGDGAIVTRGAEELAIDAAIVRCDAVLFDEALQGGDPAAALQLYRGGFLEGFHADGAPGFGEWIDLERARTHRLAVEAAVAASDLARNAGDGALAIAAARRAVEIDPLDEPAVRALMSVEASLGNRTAALAAFEAFRARLRAQLDVEPTVETIELVRALSASMSHGGLALTDKRDHSISASGADHGDFLAGRRQSNRSWARTGVGIASTVAVAGLWWQLAATGPMGDAGPAHGDSLQSLAVLPLSFSGDPKDSLLADGMHELLIQGFARAGGIRMPGSGRVATYRGKTADPRRVGRQLGVKTVLTGSVHVADGRIRVSSELTRASDGAVIWSDRFDGVVARGDTILDLFDIQDSMTSKVVAALMPEVAARGSATARGVPTRNNEAYRLYLSALHAPTSPEGDQLALQLLRRALDLDSTFSDAWVQYARRLTFPGGRLTLSPVDFAVAWRRAIEKAIEYDTLNAEAFSERAFYRIAYEWDFDAARSDARRAVALNPALSEPLMAMARVQGWNDSDSAIVYLRRATVIDPMNPMVWNQLGRAYSGARMPDSAIAASERSIAIDSTMWHTNFVLMHAYRDLGRVREANEAEARLIRHAGRAPGAVAMRAAYHAKWGDRATARRLRQQLEERARREHIPSIFIAVLRFAAADTNGALDALEASLAERDVNDFPALLNTYFSQLRGSKRFDTIRRRVLGDREMRVGPYAF